MINPKEFFDTLKKQNIEYFTGVPDSLLKDICAYITENTTNQNHIITANEGSAVAMATGYHLATKKVACVYMQNSGLGNTVNPLLSLADDKVYSIPMLVLIGWRGRPSIKDEPQHIRQGEVMLPMLEAMQYPYTILDIDNWQSCLESSIEQTKQEQKPVFVVVKESSFSKYPLKKQAFQTDLTREKALETVLESIENDAIIVSTTGKLSRELYEIREKKQQSHQQEFMTVGSMGHTSSIALAIALQQPSKKVYALDGDGSLLMHMGALATIGSLQVDNFTHIIFNNNAHESVGAQPTVASNIDLQKITQGCGYSQQKLFLNIEDLKNALNDGQQTKGSKFFEIRVNLDSREDLGRPTSTPKQNKMAFMNYLLTQ